MQKLLEYWPLILSLILFVSSVAIFLHWNNNALQVTNHTVSSGRIPKDFDGFKIVQISDLHNAAFGKDNRHLLEKIRQQTPDIIVITGDIVHAQPMDNALIFARQVVQIAPTYYVPGNHEFRIHYKPLFDGLQEAGVILLLNQSTAIQKDDQWLNLIGIEDPTFYPDAAIEDKLQPLIQKNAYNIVLSHRPELFDTYTLCDADLVFTGHAHGGQFRLPFIGGLFAPSQGIFPKYDAGIFANDKTQMVVSRGLGNSSFPFRLFNRPEIVVVTLKKAE